jgi:dihydrolipoamide dehydrogenase
MRDSTGVADDLTQSDSSSSPATSTDSSSTASFDVVVIGAGSGGYACALRAAELGLRVAMVERDLVGGTCLHRGCIPTKALLHVAETADAVRESAEIGVRADLHGVDYEAASAFAGRTVARLDSGLRQLIKSRGIVTLVGTAALDGPHTVVVEAPDGTTGRYEGTHVVIATGASPRSLPGIEPDGARVITSNEALKLTELPARAIVLGGGVIGVEFASMWTSMGVDVTILEALDRLLPTEDAASSSALQRAWRKRGIDVRTGVRVTGVESRADGVSVQIEDGDPLDADLLLVAVGRGPVTDALGLAAAGVAVERGFVTVDAALRTSAAGVWAVGDVVAGLQLAHRGFAHGIHVAEQIHAATAGTPAPAPLPPEEHVPRITYSDPEVGSVGLTEVAAQDRYGADRVQAFSYPLGANGRSLVLGTAGHAKLIRVLDGPIVGVHVVGRRAGELMGEAMLMVGWEAHPEDVAGYIHPHPTQSEAIGEAALALAGKPLHVHG